VPQMQRAEQHAQLATAAVSAAQRNPDLPVVYLSPAPLFEDERKILEVGGIPVCRSTLDTVAVAKALLPLAALEDGRPESIAIERASDTSLTGPLSEHRSKSLLRSHGMVFSEEILLTTLQDALEAAARMTYPLVLKASGAGIWHKSEQRLVELNIRDEVDLCTAWKRLHERLSLLHSVEVEGILMSPFIDDGVDVIIGFTRDPEFGLLCVLGPGGVFAELFGADGMRHLTLPISRSDIERALGTGPLARLLEGYRGGDKCDRCALIEYMVEAGRVAFELGTHLVELDLNPIRVRTRGRGAVALDALCVFREP